MSKIAEELKDTLNNIERDVYDGINLGDMFIKAYVLADELGESIDKLRDENAKLRELLADAWGYINHPANATWTHAKRKEVRHSIGERMRELGTEVD